MCFYVVFVGRIRLMSIHLPQNLSQMVFVLDDYFKSILHSKNSPNSANLVETCKPVFDQLFSMFELLSFPIMISSHNDKFVYANSAFLQTTQLTHSEMLGLSFSQFASTAKLNFNLSTNSLQKITFQDKKYTVRSFPFGITDNVQNFCVHFFELDTTDNFSQPDVRKVFIKTIQAIAQTLEQRDPYTAGHQRRVSELARAIGQELLLDEQILEGLEFGGLIHDVGKIQVPSDILSKPGKLRKEEVDLIKLHPQNGFAIIKEIEFPWPIGDIVLQHHERLDGSGYPNQLSGDAICLEAKIIAVADVVEAMSSHRPYRPALGIEVTLDEIENKSKVYYDPIVVNACSTLFRNKNFTFSLE